MSTFRKTGTIEQALSEFLFFLDNFRIEENIGSFSSPFMLICYFKGVFFVDSEVSLSILGHNAALTSPHLPFLPSYSRRKLSVAEF